MRCMTTTFYCENFKNPSISNQICTTSLLVIGVQGYIKQQGDDYKFEALNTQSCNQMPRNGTFCV
jgi:hypothetical protein